MDHSARGSMKNAASCETWCELQDTLSTDLSNAHCGPGFLPGPRLSEGRTHKTVRRGVREEPPARPARFRRTKAVERSDGKASCPSPGGNRSTRCQSRSQGAGLPRSNAPRGAKFDAGLVSLKGGQANTLTVDLRSDETTR